MTPNLDYLRKVERGEIIVRVKTKGGITWSVTGGAYQLRRHEEAGFVRPVLTAQWSGFPDKMQTEGTLAKLTEEGLRAIGQALREP